MFASARLTSPSTRRASRPVRPPRRFAVVLLTIVVSALALATGASAEIITTRDNQGRTIRFDVRTPVDVEWYAAILRAAAHGNEISTVTIRIVPEPQIEGACGAAALACYGRRDGTRTIVVPAGQGDHLKHTLLHEYGHHLDSAWSVVGSRRLDGTPVWWQLRGMQAYLNEGTVAFDYSRGWSHSIPEVFAEDYAYIHFPFRYAIRWLSPPDDALRTAMFQELAGTAPPAPIEVDQTPQPLVINRAGTLARASVREFPFGLLGPGRRVTLTVTVAGANRAGTRARAEVVCNGTRVASRSFVRRVSTRTIDVRNLGPADCRARVVSTSRIAHRFTLRLRLAIEA